MGKNIKPEVKKILYVARHCESEENEDGRRRGNLGGLSPLGKLQAAALAKRMKKLGVEALFSSPAERALTTAHAISLETGLPIHESELFIERQRPFATLGRLSDDPGVRKIHRSVDVSGIILGERKLGADIVSDVLSSVREGLTVLLSHPAKKIGVITHNIKLRVLFTDVYRRGTFSLMGPHDYDDAYYVPIFNNGGITTFKYQSVFQQPDKFLWQIGCMNDTSHLEDIEE